MDNITLDQYKELRRQGLSQEQIKDLQKRGKITEAVQPKETFMQKGLLRSAGSFLGMEQFGRGIGQAIYNISGANKANQQQILEQQEETTTNLVNAIKDARARGDLAAVERLTKAAETFQTDSAKTDFVGMGTQ